MAMTIRRHVKISRRTEVGMSLVELMIAMVVLLVGVVGSVALIAVSMGGNGRNRHQSNSTAIARMVVEKISSVPASLSPNLTVTDCSGANNTVATGAGGSALTSSGDVDFSQAAVANYSMFYTVCGPTGQRAIYDVRWNIQSPSGFAKRLTVSARMKGAGSNPLLFSLPVTIRTLVGQGT